MKRVVLQNNPHSVVHLVMIFPFCFLQFIIRALTGLVFSLVAQSGFFSVVGVIFAWMHGFWCLLPVHKKVFIFWVPFCIGVGIVYVFVSGFLLV